MNAPSKDRRLASWGVTVLLAYLLIGSAVWWRMSTPDVKGPVVGITPVSVQQPLPRTRHLVQQKIDSLAAYNPDISVAALHDAFSSYIEGRPVSPDVFATLDRLMTQKLTPWLWRSAQAKSGDSRFVTHKAMSEVIRATFPQHLLPNGDVVLLPDNPEIRLVVYEYKQDYLRDTAWHWKWIGATLARVEPGTLRELDIYAAEELSEFLSVMAVALVGWGHRFSSEDAPLTGEMIERVLDVVAYQSTSGARPDAVTESVRFSALVKDTLLHELPEPMYVDVTASIGVDFIHQPDPALYTRRSELEVPTGIAGGGVSAADFDGDGFTDLYFAGAGGGRLYRNEAGQRLRDVTDAAGLSHAGETRAGYFIDYDNDGDLDLFQTCVYQSNRLLRNEGGYRFRDVTESTGLGGDEKTVSHEAVWFDFDNDGLLDVYVANFGDWPGGASPKLGPRNQDAPPNALFHHRRVAGAHVFTNVASRMGVDDRGWTHCVGAWDHDQDGFMDLISLNDFGTSLVYHNQGGTRFAENARSLRLDTIYNAMNFELLDLDHSGHPSLYITQIHKLTHRERYSLPSGETHLRFEHLGNTRTLVRNFLLQRQPAGMFQNVHDIRVEPAEHGWAWEAGSFDYENDGDLDLLILNGTEANSPMRQGETREPHFAGRVFMSQHGNQRNVCYMAEDGYFYDVSTHCALSYVGNSRSAAFFDLDNDGDLDVAINDYRAPARIFENRQHSGNSWIRLRLEGERSTRNAFGARVEIRFGSQRRFAQVVSGTGFLAQNPMALHFGIGNAQQVDTVIIIWPATGRVQELGALASNQMHVLREPR